MTAAEWRMILACELDSPTVAGRLRRLKARSLGHGFVDVYKEPLDA
jgi:hypothetical protein